MPNDIAVIGSSNVDLIMTTEHLPAQGETVTNGVFFQALPRCPQERRLER